MVEHGDVPGLVLVPDGGVEDGFPRHARAAFPGDARRGEQRAVYLAVRFQDVGKAVRPFRNLEVERRGGTRVAETYHHHPFAFLRQAEVQGVEDVPFHVVSERGERPQDGGESPAPVVRDELLHVFEQHGPRAVMPQYPGHFKEHGAAYVAEAFHLAHDAESLTREAGQEYVVRRDILRRDARDVAARAFAEVGLVCVAGGLVPFRGEHAPVSQLVERDADAAYSGEKVYESKSRRHASFLVLCVHADGDGAAVEQLHFHLRAELPRLHGLAEHFSQLPAETFVEGDGGGASGGADV